MRALKVNENVNLNEIFVLSEAQAKKSELRNRGLSGGKSEGYGNNKIFYSYLIEPFA